MHIEDNNIKQVIVNSYQQLNDVLLAFEHVAQYRTIFESPIWLNTWYQHYWQPNWQLNCVVYYQNDKLIGFAPFYICNSTAFPFLKTLHFIGQGEPETAEVASEYLDIQIVEGYESLVYSLLSTYLNSATFDVFNANALLANAHIVNILPQLNGSINSRDYCRYILNCSEWSIQAISKNTRSRIKRTHNQLQQHNVDIRWLTEAEVHQCWPTLVSFHQQRWQTKGRSGAFHAPAFNLFHLNLIKHHASNVCASAIFIDEKPIAINYYLKDKHTLYFYQSGWDQQNYAKLSPGLYLHYWSIEHCSLTSYDFMMGGLNDSYKAKFVDKPQPMVSFNLVKSKYKLLTLKIMKAISKKLFPVPRN